MRVRGSEGERETRGCEVRGEEKNGSECFIVQQSGESACKTEIPCEVKIRNTFMCCLVKVTLPVRIHNNHYSNAEKKIVHINFLTHKFMCKKVTTLLVMSCQSTNNERTQSTLSRLSPLIFPSHSHTNTRSLFVLHLHAPPSSCTSSKDVFAPFSMLSTANKL